MDCFDCEGRSLAYEELLGRSEWTVAQTEWSSAGELGPVLVTGAAGSIGRAFIGKLIETGVPVVALDSDETRLHALALDFSIVRDRCVLADIADEEQVDAALNQFQPSTVVHLAAKKHVVFTERAVRATVNTNIGGSLAVIGAAGRCTAVRRLVIASSDKVVEARSVLGQSKRIVELLAGGFSTTWSGVVSVVRFCNILGTGGGVLDHFVHCALRGEPLMVWSSDMSRYFASLNEAVALLLVATYKQPRSGTITLDPGEPINILELARNVVVQLHDVYPRISISECFDSVHARHERLWGDQERVAPLSSLPRVLAVERPIGDFASSRQRAKGLIESNGSDLELRRMLYEFAQQW